MPADRQWRGMHKGIIAYAVIMAILVALWYFYDDFAIPFGHSMATTVAGNGLTTGYSTVPGNVYTCIGADAVVQGYNSVLGQNCTWGGGAIALWGAAGTAEYAYASVTGQDGRVYISQNFTNPCVRFNDVYNLPRQKYYLAVRTGPRNYTQGVGSCGYSGAELDSLPDSNSTTFNKVINGNFVTGTYYGWAVAGPAFGTAPLNLTKANIQGCYPMAANWSGYNGTYFASTYACGLGSSGTGNLTSAQFIANGGFLNFQILGGGGVFSYIEILYGNQSRIRADFSTSNMSSTRNGAFTLTNATIPLLTVKNRPVRIRIVVNEQTTQDFLVVGDFRMGSTPVPMRPGTLVNVTLS